MYSKRDYSLKNDYNLYMFVMLLMYKGKRVMMHISLDGYDIEMLSDLAEYLYDEKIEFETLEQARDFFNKN